mgnify:CR=1 FL=1
MAEQNLKINIAKDFSKFLGGRWRNIGKFSGEEFYEEKLRPMYIAAVKLGVKLDIYLDGTKGYPSSFLDQSFGELARKEGVEKVASVLELHAEVFVWVVDFIKKEIWHLEK